MTAFAGRFCLLLLWATTFCLQANAANPLENWNWRLPDLRPNVDYSSVAHGNGVFVVVGSAGTILVSSDAHSWIPIKTSQGLLLTDVTYGKGIFVAVSAEGIILTSENGLKWTERDVGTNPGLATVVCGNDRFVAGGNGFVLVSSNGIDWTRISIAPYGYVSRIAYGNGLFMAVVNGGAISISSDGVSWTVQSGSEKFGLFIELAFGNGVFLVASEQRVMFTSANGVVWSPGSPLPVGGTGRPYLASGNGVFLASVGGGLFASGDGENWSGAARGNFNRVGYANGFFFSFLFGGIRSSYDALAWTDQGPPGFDFVSQAGGAFLALGRYSARSEDGIEWRIGTNPVPNLVGITGVAHGNGVYVALGLAGSITSTDGLNWTGTLPGGHRVPRAGIVFGNGYFVADDISGSAIMRSADGTNWVVSVSPPDVGFSSPVWAIAFGNGRFVAVGDEGKVLVSTNAVDWSLHESGTTNAFYGLSFVNGRFVGVTRVSSGAFRYGELMISNDGMSWQSYPANPQATPTGNGIIYCHGTYLARDDYGVAYSSSNALDWVRMNAQYLSGVRALACDDDSAVAIASGRIIQSDPLAPSAPAIVLQPLPRTVRIDEIALLSGEAYGSRPLSYRWSKDGKPMEAETNAVLSVHCDSLSKAGHYRVLVSNATGIIESDVAALQVLPASGPIITGQPQGTNLTVGAVAYLPVVAEGNRPFNYQWKKNDEPMIGATNAALAFRALSESDAGDYTVVVANHQGCVTSSAATIAVSQPARPLILTQPLDRVVTNGADVDFRVTAAGVAPLRYQWTRENLALPGATNDTLTLTNIQWPQAGSYRVVVSNAAGFVQSRSALLTVYTYPGIRNHPQSRDVAVGAPVAFTMEPSFAIIPPPTVQWLKDGEYIPLATNSTLVRPAVQMTDAGAYAVMLSNVVGTVLSESAALRVYPVSPLDYWQRIGELSPVNSLLNVTYLNGTFIAVGAYRMATSSNGVDWCDVQFEGPITKTFFDIAYGNDQFVAVGAGSGIAFTYSGDPARWAHTSARITGFLRGVAHGAGMFIAVGDHGIVASSNGEDWLAITNINSLADVIFADERFVAVGYYGIVTSRDGRSWVQSLVPPILQPPITRPPAFSSVAFGNHRYVAVSGSAGMFSSPDGLSWSLPDGAAIAGLKGVVFGDGIFLAYGGGAIYSSEDATRWIRRNVWTNSLLATPVGYPDLIAFGNGTFLHLAAQNSVFTSEPLLKIAVRWEECPELLIWGMPGHVCHVDYTDSLDLAANSWQPLRSVELQTYPTVLLDRTSSATGQRFYRATSSPRD